MSPKTRAAVCLYLLAAVAVGCNTASHHKTLTRFFDGVPPPKAGTNSPEAQGGAPTGQQAGVPAAYTEHGPYAAKACDACHNAAATNALIVPKAELCARCHQLSQDVKYVHGPLASGGCLLCHDPHRSRYRSLLLSDSGGFCFRCHDRAAISRIEEHANLDADCTACHNAHGSEKKYLLR